MINRAATAGDPRGCRGSPVWLARAGSRVDRKGEHPACFARSSASPVMSEQHPLCLGVYEGAMGRDDVRAYVESSDCVMSCWDVYDRHQSRHLYGPARPRLINQRDQRKLSDPVSRLRGGALQGLPAWSRGGRCEVPRTRAASASGGGAGVLGRARERS